MKISRQLRALYFLEEIGVLNLLPDFFYLKLIYRIRIGRKLNLKNPQTYTEKIQWIKLFDRNPLYTKLVDKYEVKKYVANTIGTQYIIPTIGVWESFDDIKFDELPEQFVLKCTHDSGGLIICKNKSQLDIKAAKEKIEKCLNRSYYWHGREWPYKNVKPRIIAEEYMEDTETQELRDYKFFAFDGETKALFIATDRQKKGEETKFDFFDSNFQHLPLINGHPNATIVPKKPVHFDEMKRLAGILSKGFPEVRVDFYEVNGKIYFGELTFAHWSGLTPFEPEKWDYRFGSWINLPKR